VVEPLRISTVFTGTARCTLYHGPTVTVAWSWAVYAGIPGAFALAETISVLVVSLVVIGGTMTVTENSIAVSSLTTMVLGDKMAGQLHDALSDIVYLSPGTR
jgi:hypothetical protein